jgi:hypothetical protein
MVAIASSEEVQVADAVRFRSMLSEKVPTAVNCKVVPGALLEAAEITFRETRTGGGPALSFFVPQPRTIAGRSTAVTITIHDRNLFIMVPFRLFCENTCKVTAGDTSADTHGYLLSGPCST